MSSIRNDQAIEKAWGHTRIDVESDLYQHHTLGTLAGGYSSVHYHRERHNRFKVVSGVIRVITYDAWLVNWRDLSADEETDVPANSVHQFVVLEEGKVYEEYWPTPGGTVKQSDIVRLNTGGRIQPGLDWENAFDPVNPVYDEAMDAFASDLGRRHQ